MAVYEEIAQSGEALIAELEDSRPGEGELVAWWLGQQSWLLRIGATRILIDPYLAVNERRRKPPLLTPEQCAGIDLVLCTHDHSDHVDPEAIPGIAAASQATFVTSRAIEDRMRSLQVPIERWCGLNDGESLTVGDVTVTAIKAAHEFFDRTSEGYYPYLTFVLDGPGITAWHAGDTLWWEGLQGRLAEHLPIDVAFVPINGRDGERYRRNTLGNLSFAEAADLVGPLPVGLAVPSHFDMFQGNLGDPALFTDYLAAKYPEVPSWVGRAGEALWVRR